MTKEITLPSGRYLLVKVPDECTKFEILYDTIFKVRCIKEYKKGSDSIIDEIKLIEGFWGIVGKAYRLTEDQWKGIVEEEYFEDDSNYFFIYEKEGMHRANLFYDNAKESGLSLLKANGFEIDTTLILKID